ncbi:hypothetical protein EJ08DRAFT_654898 [Tothia fuscella]|uniref:Quinone oxidoreductase n=1 Tax=Tothia fuscella TaxID=1048955 RepID=A0A9P4P3G0_9PEZI|nr:hypothetical protein EJ08DRAFT_654898 [Tothia fuscella]
MYGVLVTNWSKAPIYVELDNPSIPDPGTVQIKVTATGLHSVVRSRASGKHFSSGDLPHVPGVDGVGKTSDGQSVYFSTFNTGGSYCDVVNVPRQAISPLPAGVDEIQVAAYTNPGLSSWMALKTRTNNLPPNFTVLIMGTTSASGTFAVSVARALGAGRVIGCARNTKKMSSLGLDEMIELREPVADTDFSMARDVDVVLDYLYGAPTEQLFKSPLASSRRVQYVHIGGLAGLEFEFARCPHSIKEHHHCGVCSGQFRYGRAGGRTPKAA